MRLKINCLIFIFLSVFSLSKSEDLSFHHLNVQDGISQNSVTSIIQDSIGRIWMGTRDGLNVFDGTSFRVFRPVRGDSTSLSGHFVSQLITDKNTIWVTTKNGLSRLDLKKLSFSNFQINNLTCIIPFNDKILVGTREGLVWLTPENKRISKCDLLEDANVVINNLYTDKSEVLWISTNQGLFTYHSKTARTSKIMDMAVSCVFTDKNKQIWIGTQDEGVFLLNNQKQVIKHFIHKNNEPNTLINNTIRDIKDDSNGNIWIATFKGLSIINCFDYKIINQNHQENNPNSISNNSIYSILKDKQGTMWLGTYFGGVNYHNPDFDVYTHYFAEENSDNHPGFNVIGEMIQDKSNNNIWIATEGGGIDFFNRSTGKFSHYNLNEGNNGLPHNNVKALALYNNNILLAGTHRGGLCLLNYKTGKTKYYTHDSNNPNSIQTNIIDEIIPYKDFFLLGAKPGLIKFDIKNQTFEPYTPTPIGNMFENSLINCLYIDSYNRLWIGTENEGLYVYNESQKSIKRYQTSSTDLKTIGSNNITTIFEDHQFKLWIGTQGGGLQLYKPDTDDFQIYNTENSSLPSDFIQAIKESRYGHLWVTTAKGLSRFDIDNKKIFNYSHQNGFPLNELNQKSLLITNDGDVFVGGFDGMVSFNEENMLNRSSNFEVLFTSLNVNNKMILPGDKSGILKIDLPFTDKIELQPFHNIFSIGFSSNNFVSTNQNTFKYKLDGFNEEWIPANEKTMITYTNLNAGQYKLIVRGLSGVEGNVISEKSISILIHPPLYRTWYAYLCYVIVIGLITLWLSHMFRARLLLVHQIEQEQREKEQIKSLNQSKLNFFTNISHEFRTPLTLITGTLESVMENEKTRPENYQKLKKTYHNAIRLNNLITELLDFRKLEHGSLKLKVSENKLSDFMDDIYNSFTGYANRYNVNFSLNIKDKDLVLWFDVVQMEKVIYNLISNAFKHTEKDTGKILVEVENSSSHVNIIVNDNGAGMSELETQRIFDLYYQVDNMQAQKAGTGSGIGLALCKSIVELHKGNIDVRSIEGKGTTFMVKLLKGNQHFDKENILSLKPSIDSNLNQPYNPQFSDDEETTEIELHPHSILIVEDNIEVQQLLEDLLQDNYNIYIANNGVEGLELAIKKQPDLVLSDIMMPEMMGTEMCIKLKRNVQTSHIPVILLTARASDDYKIEGLDTGADDYITKPFNSRILKAKVKNMIQNRILLQQKYKQNPSASVKDIATNSIDQKLLTQATNIVEKHLDDTEFDVQVFASEMNLGRTRLYSKIKGVTGLTPNDFILSVRLKKSAEMLLVQTDELNISQIAYSVGFSTPRYFSRCFKQHFGVSPSNYGKVEYENEASGD